MERVKGEKYWSVVQTKHGFEVCDFIDDFDEWDNADFEIGNRFPDRESAEEMANKFRAVLKGAEVIEMPSEEDVSFESAHLLSLSKYFVDSDRESEAYLSGFDDCLHWLKSKVK